jgi:hypothetical protein
MISTERTMILVGVSDKAALSAIITDLQQLGG